jgi:cell wall-associated NlpC family hydrolase
MVNGDQIVAEARRYLGVVYRHQGYSRVGMDCWGLVRVTLAAFDLFPSGMPLPERYGGRPDRTTVDNVERFGIRQAKPTQGCLVLISWPRDPYPTHLGFFADGNLIHSYARSGKVVEHGYRAPWTRLTHGFYGLPGVQHG